MVIANVVTRCPHDEKIENDAMFSVNSLRKKFYVSFAVNIVFIILFIIVFLFLGNLKSRIDKQDEVLQRFEIEFNINHGDVSVSVEEGQISQHRLSETDHFGKGTWKRRKDNSLSDKTLNSNKNETKDISSSASSTSDIRSRKVVATTDEVQTITGQVYKRSTLPETRSSALAKSLQNGMNKTGSCTCVGLRGPPGKSGKAVKRGKKGPKGDTGPLGPQGQRGLQGLPGPVGPQGGKGERGWPGKIGPHGALGAPGGRGPMGVKGQKGESGHDLVIRPSAHITGRVESMPVEPKGILTKFQDRYRLAHSYGEMKYKDGKLTIPKTGFYHVYSQVFFQADEPKEHLMVSFIYRISGDKQGILVRSIATKCYSPNGGKTFYTTYNAGVFRLLLGDVIMLGVSPDHENLVSYHESATYFGAFEI